MFPRVVLHDGRGTFISLSHFCPTAAGLLFDHGESWPPVGIVDAPPALTDVGPLDGLDARDAWPPLLRPGVMMDLESYGAWERLGVELLTREGIAPDVSLDALASATGRIASWSPGGATPLLHAVRDAFGTLAPPAAVLDVHEPRGQTMARRAAVRQLDRLPGRRPRGDRPLPARLPRHVHHRARAGRQPARSHPPERSPDRPQGMTLDDLRRFAVARSLFAPVTLKRAIERLGFVQADPIRAPARAQDLTLRHRVKGYRAGDLERRFAALDIDEEVLRQLRLRLARPCTP